MELTPITIWLPHIIYSDRALSGNAKLILAEILNLLKVDRKHCWASNDHFARLFGLSRANVSYHIQQLEKGGWIISKAYNDCTLEFCDLRRKGWHRHIMPNTPLSKILDSLSSQTLDPIKNIVDPIKSPKLISNTYKYTGSNIDTNVSIGDRSPKKTIDERFGKDEVLQILSLFETYIGHIPADRSPRNVAYNIYQLIQSFKKQNGAVFKELRGEELTFDYVLSRSWDWYKKKDYCDSTEKLETFKLKMKVFLSDIEKKLNREKERHYVNTS